MADNQTPSIDAFMEGKEKQQRSHSGWRGFVEGDVVNFMQEHNIEKMTLDEGTGNKAKLTRGKDNTIRVETSSISIL